VCRSVAANRANQLQFNGVSATSDEPAKNMFLQHVCSYPVVHSANSSSQRSASTGGIQQPAAVLIATSVCRISRHAGILQLVCAEARARNVHVVVLLHNTAVLEL
jgi:hypothetical protein